MSKEFFFSLDDPPLDFSLDLFVYYSAKKRNLSINRFPVYFGIRSAGEAHLNSLKAKLKYCYKIICYSFELRKKIIKKNIS